MSSHVHQYLYFLLLLLCTILIPNESFSSTRRAILYSPLLLDASPSIPTTSSSSPYDGYAANYDSLDNNEWLTEALGLRKGRRDLLSKVKGDVLEVGCGTGINLQFYPLPSISTLTLLDSSPGMLSLASEKVLSLPPPLPKINAIVGDVLKPSTLPSPLPSYDYIVSTFTLCVIPSPSTALSNLSSLLKPGGRILLFENSRSSSSLIASYQDFTASAASDFGGKGCVYNQDVAALIRKAGLDVLEERSYAAGLFRSYVCAKGT